STDNGISWSAVNNGISYSEHVHALAAIGNYIYAGTDHGVYSSSNNGMVWTNSNQIYYAAVNALAISGKHIFAGTNGHGIFTSTNNGTSWGAVDNGLPTKIIYSLCSINANIIAGTQSG